MIPIDAMVVMLVVSYGALGILAVALGHGTATLLRLRWSGRTAVADATLAIAMGMACVVVTTSLNPNRSGGLTWIAALSLLSVVLRHLGRFVAVRRSAHTAT